MTTLVDTSAMIAAQRRGGSTLGALAPVFEGDVWTCDVVRLELLRGGHNPRHMALLRAQLDEVWSRAMEVYEGLAHLNGGRHRGVEPTDVLVAAAAEAQELVVLHDDAHFVLIAEVTGQEMVRLPT